ncbi:MAG: hypothetical protein LBQ96_05665 [Fusobacteriaceae bacterium]|jgi:hypothetical protein|nr:hypothetical protein [Fusobacteriaceae bacterium]
MNLKKDDPVPMQGYCSEMRMVYKVKKFACKSLKNKGARTGLRVIYVYDKSPEKITFVEIYYKQDKDMEDRDRLVGFLESKDICSEPETNG